MAKIKKNLLTKTRRDLLTKNDIMFLLSSIFIIILTFGVPSYIFFKNILDKPYPDEETSLDTTFHEPIPQSTKESTVKDSSIDNEKTTTIEQELVAEVPKSNEKRLVHHTINQSQLNSNVASFPYYDIAIKIDKDTHVFKSDYLGEDSTALVLEAKDYIINIISVSCNYGFFLDDSVPVKELYDDLRKRKIYRTSVYMSMYEPSLASIVTSTEEKKYDLDHWYYYTDFISPPGCSDCRIGEILDFTSETKKDLWQEGMLQVYCGAETKSGIKSCDDIILNMEVTLRYYEKWSRKKIKD
jgi:hypothetical protein